MARRPRLAGFSGRARSRPASVLGRRLRVERAARVDVRCNLDEQLVELLALGRVERAEEFVFELFDDLAQPRQLTFPRCGDGDDVAPAVLGIALALDQAALLE